MIKDILEKRITTYKFLNKTPGDKDMKYVLESAILSPRLSASQEIEFIIINEQDTKDKISSLIATPFINSAPYIIVIISNQQAAKAEFGDDGEKFSAIDAHFTMYTLVIAAEEKGMSSAIVFPQLGIQEVKTLLSIPDDYKIEGIIALGYAAEKGSSKLVPDLGAVLHINKYKQ